MYSNRDLIMLSKNGQSSESFYKKERTGSWSSFSLFMFCLQMEEIKLKEAIIGSVDDVVGGKDHFKDALLAAMYSQVEFLRSELSQKNSIIQTLLARNRVESDQANKTMTVAGDRDKNDVEDEFVDNEREVSENARRKLMRKVSFVNSRENFDDLEDASEIPKCCETWNRYRRSAEKQLDEGYAGDEEGICEDDVEKKLKLPLLPSCKSSKDGLRDISFAGNHL